MLQADGVGQRNEKLWDLSSGVIVDLLCDLELLPLPGPPFSRLWNEDADRSCSLPGPGGNRVGWRRGRRGRAEQTTGAAILF